MFLHNYSLFANKVPYLLAFVNLFDVFGCKYLRDSSRNVINSKYALNKEKKLFYACFVLQRICAAGKNT